MSSRKHYHDRAEPQDDSDRYTFEEADDLDESAFEGGTIGRRTFLSVAAATGAALALPSTVSAQVSDDRVTDEAEFAVNATESSYEATLLLEFANGDAVHAFYDEFGDPDWHIEEDDRAAKVVYREEPTPAAHAYLTEDELTDALELDGVEFVDFSPGANPFWKLEEPYGDYEVYPEFVDDYDVFPDVEVARDFISYEEAGQSLDHIAAEYPDMVNVERIGHGPGHENHITGEERDQRELYIVELTNDVQDREAFAEKEKAVFTVGIHANEQAGREAGSRIIENAAKGEADEFNPLLDDIAIIYLYINPDGWLRRKPHIAGSPDEPIISHARGNASGLDTNRQYPTIGWANPSFWPAEPAETVDPRPGYDVGYEYMVPDALAAVEHLRGYDNVEYLCDYHMMGASDQLVLNLESNATYEHDGTHNLDEVNRQIGDAMYDHWGGPEAIGNDTQRAAGYVPSTLFDYGSIYDSLGYNITGGLLGWAGIPEEQGGLGAITVAPELGLRDFTNWRPYIERHLETAYYLSMREFAEMCAANTDATVATGDQDVAYVPSETLTRSSADLSHTPDDGPGNGQGPPAHAGGTRIRRGHTEIGRGHAGRSNVSASEETHSLSARFHAHGIEEGMVKVVNPGGEVVRTVDLAEADGDCCMTDETSVFVADPEPGKWAIEYEGDADVDVETVLVDSDEEHPNPEEAFGYSQQEYEVNPMEFFEDLAPFLKDGSIKSVSQRHVSAGRLLRGQSSERNYDKLVISHNDGIDDTRYISAIEEFVEAGGDLVLTDTGLYLLAELEVGEAAAISEDDLETTEVRIANVRNRNFDHYLLQDIRELQNEVWKSPQVGYSANEEDQPVTIIDEDAFEAAGGEMAGTMGGFAGWVWDEDDGWEYIEERGEVGAGSLSAGDAEINVIGSALPPAYQEYLHPFGMADHALSFMGHTMMCNALGFEQRRFVNGDLVGTWGEVR